MSSLRVTTRAALAAVLLAVVTACGDGGGESAAPQATPEATTQAPTTAATTQGPGEVSLLVGTTPLGDVLTDSEGRTLYMFDPDQQGPSTCYDQCAQAWPPLTVEGEPVAGEGVDASLLGVTERTDGAQQVTYNRWPLYYFARDAAAGDVNGQGVNGVWWVLDGAGQPVR